MCASVFCLVLPMVIHRWLENSHATCRQRAAGAHYPLGENTVYLDCLRGEKMPQSLCSFHRPHLALHVGHNRVSTSPVHYAVVQKVGETQFAGRAGKRYEKLWLLCRTKVSYYLGGSQCILINLIITYLSGKIVGKEFEYVRVCARAVFSVHVQCDNIDLKKN